MTVVIFVFVRMVVMSCGQNDEKSGRDELDFGRGGGSMGVR